MRFLQITGIMLISELLEIFSVHSNILDEQKKFFKYLKIV